MDRQSERIVRAKQILRRETREQIVSSGITDNRYSLEQLVDIYDVYSSMPDKSVLKEMWKRGYEWTNSHWHK